MAHTVRHHSGARIKKPAATSQRNAIRAFAEHTLPDNETAHAVGDNAKELRAGNGQVFDSNRSGNRAMDSNGHSAVTADDPSIVNFDVLDRADHDCRVRWCS